VANRKNTNTLKAILKRMAFASNQVWNAVLAETSKWCFILYLKLVLETTSRPLTFDLQKQLKTINKERDFIIHFTTVQEVIAIYRDGR